MAKDTPSSALRAPKLWLKPSIASAGMLAADAAGAVAACSFMAPFKGESRQGATATPQGWLPTVMDFVTSRLATSMTEMSLLLPLVV